MSNLLFLVVPAVIAALAVTVVWLRNRPETSPTSGIDRFSGQMAALAPEQDTLSASSSSSSTSSAEVGIRVQPVGEGEADDPSQPAEGAADGVDDAVRPRSEP